MTPALPIHPTRSVVWARSEESYDGLVPRVLPSSLQKMLDTEVEAEKPSPGAS